MERRARRAPHARIRGPWRAISSLEPLALVHTRAERQALGTAVDYRCTPHRDSECARGGGYMQRAISPDLWQWRRTWIGLLTLSSVMLSGGECFALTSCDIRF